MQTTTRSAVWATCVACWSPGADCSPTLLRPSAGDTSQLLMREGFQLDVESPDEPKIMWLRAYFLRSG